MGQPRAARRPPKATGLWRGPLSISPATRLREVAARRPAVAAFAGVFSATFLGFLAIGAVLPVLPRYVKGPVGAGDVAVGVVIGAFAATAFVGRPIGGRLADRHGRRIVVLAGLLICAVAGALLFLPFGVPGLVLARLVIGLGDGWVFTAGLTWIVDLAPAHRRGQAIGVFGLAIWGGLTVGAIIGEGVFALGGFEAVWAFAALSPLAGACSCPPAPGRPAAARGRGRRRARRGCCRAPRCGPASRSRWPTSATGRWRASSCCTSTSAASATARRPSRPSRAPVVVSPPRARAAARPPRPAAQRARRRARAERRARARGGRLRRGPSRWRARS